MTKKLSFLTAAIWAFGLFILPLTSFAELVEMSDQELNKVTGQAGFSIRADDVIKFDIEGEKITYGDPNGPNISLANTVLKGSVTSEEGVDIDFISDRFADGTVIHGVNIGFNDINLNIDEFQSEIQFGDETLGEFGMYGFKAHISGNVRIYTRN